MEVTVKIKMDVSDFTAMRVRSLLEKYPLGVLPVVDPLIRGWFLSALLVPEAFDERGLETTSGEDPPHQLREIGF